MSNNNSNNDKNKKKKPVVPPPSFHVGGPGPDVKLSLTNDDNIGDEPTRRVGGSGGGSGIAFHQPSLHQPSFGGHHYQPSPSFTSSFSSQPSPAFISTSPTKGTSSPKPSFSSQPSPSFANQYQSSRSTQQQKQQPSVSSNQQQATSSGSIGWDLTDVPTLAQFHPLERTSVIIQNTSVSTIAKRISTILQERSITATYDNKRAKARCVTDDNVDFRVRLYRGRNQYNRGIIVEIQRRYGMSTNFYNDVAAILNAAEGITTRQQQSSPIPMVSDLEDETSDISSPSGTDSLNLVQDLLRNPAYDGQVLALQTLCSLTDPKKMGRKTSYKVSSMLLQPHNSVGSTIISIVLQAEGQRSRKRGSERSSNRSNNTHYQSDDEDDYDVGDQQNEEIRLLAMTSLTNALSVVDRHSISTLKLQERLQPTLVQDLANASGNVRFAYLAAKCMNHIGSIKNQDCKREIYGVLENALQVGEERHAGLAHQVLSLLST